MKKGVESIISSGRLKFAKHLLLFGCFESDKWQDADETLPIISIIDACDHVRVNELTINLNSKFDSDLIIFSTAVMVNLTALTLSWCRPISSFAFMSLSRMKYLKKLTLSYCDIPCNCLHNLLSLSELH